MSLLSVIAANSTVIYAVCFPGLVLSAGYIGWKATMGGGLSDSPAAAPARPTQRRPLPPPVPSTKPRSIEAGLAEHQARGEAKTAKLPSAAPAMAASKAEPPPRTPTAEELDDEAKDSLFSGLGDDKPAAPVAKKPDTVMRKAERMEELGFHKQAQQAPTGAPATEAKPAPPVEAAKRAETRELSATAPAAAPAPAVAPAPAAAAAPRTQTQELDDILSRIDKVLAENPVMATMTLGSNSNETPVKPVPPKPPEKKPEQSGPDQQKLF